jgi:transposase
VLVELTSEEVESLRHYQRNTVGMPYIKVTSILMLHKGFSVADISESLGIDSSTLYRYRQSYREEGLPDFLESGNKGYWGKLSCTQISVLRHELRQHLYTDARSVTAWIAQAFDVQYTQQGVVDLLNRIGFTYKKTREVPCEADVAKQEIFAVEMGKIFEQLDDKTVVYYADGVHPTHNSRSTYAWIEKGTEFEQPTVSGRDRVNINGLVNAKDVTDIITLDCERINAQTTKDLYQLALARHPQAERIYIVSDNARYYKNKELTQWLSGTKIVQKFLPPYAPNLNLIERLWRFLRKKVINTKFYRTKELFRQAIGSFFGNIKQYKFELESLLTLNFRLANSHSISF